MKKATNGDRESIVCILADLRDALERLDAANAPGAICAQLSLVIERLDAIIGRTSP